MKCIAGALILLMTLSPAAATGAGEVDFNHDVRPILAQNCYACHGPDAEKREADLRLDTEAGAKADRDGKRAVVPKDLEQSDLIRRINSENPKKHMPPPDSGKKLTAEQIAILQKWVQEGAIWGKHWAFQPIKRPPIPKVVDTRWPAGPIDAFVLAGLEKEGLQPSPVADKFALIRRVSLDLTGLPPTPQEVDAFIADTSPSAYETLVDRLLASPAYGEKWARLWLDLARYADTKGYEKDRRRDMWPYRDWLINALNTDMPYDRFTIEQLAGDLLPNPTESQLIATAFNRNTMTNEEGGVDKEEFRVAAVKDRVDTTVQVWMGLTMGCAKCHTHKYDPISQTEYYQFYAFFNESADANRGDESPTLPLLNTAEKASNDAATKRFAPLQRWLNIQGPPFDARHAALRVTVENLRGDVIKPVLLPIMRDLPADKQRITNIQVRGSFLDPGEIVKPAVPVAFHPMPASAPMNRLGAAMWITSPQNPLTPRVLVNRFWARFFGTGIVETEEDFGSQGQVPSHPELLDYLAANFVQNGWSMKKLCREIVLSATYRQSSRATPELVAKDRFNRLLARGPRVRLDAEGVRDNALAIAGLLSHKVGGPSVMPIQPDGIWASVYSGEKWVTSPGEDRHRRGIYTFVKRTSPYPSMLAFDGTSRETCTIRRIATNTPLQALVGLNDPVYVEAAQALARRLLASGSAAEPATRAAAAIRIALARPATDLEVSELCNLYQRRVEWYSAHREAALKFATDPIGPLPEKADVAEAAAWTAVCNVVLNLDEALTKQ